MKKIRKALVAVMTVSALALTGCGAKVNAGDGGGPEAGGTVTVWSSWGEGTSQQKVYAEAFKRFTADTGIEVDAKFLGADVWTTMSTAVPAGEGPDVLPADASRVDSYSFLADLTPVLDANTPEGKKVRDGLNKNLLEITKNSNGTPVMIPDELLGYGIWFDAAQHPEWKENPPKTWDEFVAAAVASKAKGVPAISLDGTQLRQASRWYSWPLLRLGGAGAFRDLASDKTGAAWDRPEAGKAAEMLASLVAQGLFQDGFEGSKSPAAQNSWAKNGMTFLLQGSWVPDETGPQQSSGFTAAAFSFPEVSGGKGNEMAQLGALGWSISEKAKNPKAAQQLLAYLQGVQTQQAIADQAHNIPAQDSVDAPADLASFRDAIQDATSVTTTDDNAPAVGQWFDKVFTPLLTSLLSGGVSPSEFVAQGKQATIQYWQNQ